MNLRKSIQPNPELESLRLKALNSVANATSDDDVENLICRMSRIHAAFLFHSPKTLQPLLRAIGETNHTALDVGWQRFGDKLGLDVSILKVINNNQFNHEDPVYNTLLHYVQYEDATIGKILRALNDMGRLDVITRVKDVLYELSDVIFRHEQELMRSSRPRNGLNSIQNGESREEDHVVCEALIRPELIPDAPFIMKNVQSAPLLSTLLLQTVMATRTNVICSESFTRALASGTLCQASPISPNVSIVSAPASPEPRTAYGKKVMLTFAADGAEAAKTVAQILRRPREDLPRIGVLILGEQRRAIEADPTHFILAAFLQVDYVVPILTQGYLKSVLGKVRNDLSANECIDGNFVPYIYKIMMNHYTQNKCMNNKVRCLVPDDEVDSVVNHLMMAGPLFRAWEKISCAEKLAERLINSKA